MIRRGIVGVKYNSERLTDYLFSTSNLYLTRRLANVLYEIIVYLYIFLDKIQIVGVRVIRRGHLDQEWWLRSH